MEKCPKKHAKIDPEKDRENYEKREHGQIEQTWKMVRMGSRAVQDIILHKNKQWQTMKKTISSGGEVIQIVNRLSAR